MACNTCRFSAHGRSSRRRLSSRVWRSNRSNLAAARCPSNYLSVGQRRFSLLPSVVFGCSEAHCFCICEHGCDKQLTRSFLVQPASTNSIVTVDPYRIILVVLFVPTCPRHGRRLRNTQCHALAPYPRHHLPLRRHRNQPSHSHDCQTEPGWRYRSGNAR